MNLLPDFSERSLARVADAIAAERKSGDLVVLSIHWGGNWGFEVPADQREFARRLVEAAGVDIVHGHSAHHVKGLEVQCGKLIIHGCGDLLNDYERIAGRGDFLHDHSVVFLPVVDPASGCLVSLTMLPTRIRRLRVCLADAGETARMQAVLDRECRKLGTGVARTADGYLGLRW